MKSILFNQDLFGLEADARTPESFRRSLGFFNLYRLLIAAFFLLALLFYGAGSAFGAQDQHEFLRLCTAYFLVATLLFALPEQVQGRFNLTLTAGVVVDIVAMTLMMHYSGGARSGFGYMLLIVLAAAGLVGQGRLTLFHASLASLAILLEQGVRVLNEAAEPTEFFHAGVMSLGFFGSAISARFLASRIVANEELAKRRGLELESQLQINQRVIRDMQDGVLVVNHHGVVRQYNPQAASLFMLELQGATALEDFSVTLAERFHHWYEAGVETEELMRVASGQRLLRVRFLPPSSRSSNSVERGSALLYIEDMDRLQTQTQQIKLAALGRLAANMAHEIRNPLAAISHAAELLGEDHQDATHTRLTRIIGDNTERLNRIVGDVLELGRRDRTAPEHIHLAEMLGALIDELALHDKEWSNIANLEIPSDLLIRFDRGHLHRVLSNLLLNARRYCSGQSGAIRIEVVVGDEGYLELHVMDDGPGISDTLRGQVFEPFFTTHAGGTGLGLYIARELCEANGYELLLWENSPGAHFCMIGQGKA